MNACWHSIALLVSTGFLAALTYQVADAHAQHVHQYVVQEAYLLLKATIGRDVPRLHEHLGGLEPFFAGDSAWQRPYVTTGAWREDEEDVVFHYDSYQISPGFNYALVSITHFWDADEGDLQTSMFRLMVEQPPLPPLGMDIGPYENAFDKVTRYAQGGWVLWYPRSFPATNSANAHDLTITPVPLPASHGVPISFGALPQFAITGMCTLRATETSAYVVFDETENQVLDPKSVGAIRVEQDVIDAIVWETLGRMCHLLTDMSVPAHTHRDEHGLNADTYEDFMGGQDAPYAYWNHQNVGSMIDPYTSDNEPLHFLMYVVQQLTDHYASNGPADGDGNDLLAGNPRSTEMAFLNTMDLTSLGEPTTQAGPWGVNNLMNIRDKTLPLLIRATAGLLYWFATEMQLLASTTVPAQSMFPEQVTLHQNYPNPFNPGTTIEFTIPSPSAVELHVYDVLGRRVAVLLNEYTERGTYSVTFDGSACTSGLYFCHLRTGGTSLVRRMVLTR